MTLEELVEKYDQLKHTDHIDLSIDQDLSIAVMNLIGIEEHLFFSGAKTGKTFYYDLIEEVRETRKKLLKQLIPTYEGEVWCISKHLLAASYRLMEVGTKLLHQGQKQEAYQYFEQAFKLYTLFWGVNLKLITDSKIDSEVNPVESTFKEDPAEKDFHFDDFKKIEELAPEKTKKTSWVDKTLNVVKKILNCCKE